MMEVTRGEELAYLQSSYSKEGSQLLILYGQPLIGKTALLKAFVADKPYIYYAARSASDEQQRQLLCAELGLLENREAYFSYLDIFTAVEDVSSKQKKVIILDDFDRMVRQDASLFEAIASYLRLSANQRALFLLCSSRVAFVENQLVGRLGSYAHAIGAFYKIKELDFGALRTLFPNYSLADRLRVYSVLGGVPGLLRCFDNTLSFRENVCANILREGCFLRGEGGRWVADHLRETAVYHTILLQLSLGHCKLNELYDLTGFSRAKISVYLKNLMEHEIVDKVFSVDTRGSANAQKGLYRMKSHYLHFYFAFLWKNLSALELLGEEDFYDIYIEPALDEFAMLSFSQICVSYMERLGRLGRLPIACERSGSWVGKAGTIDLLATDGAGRTLVCFCHSSMQEMSAADLEWDEFLLRQAKVKADYLYLVSLHGFSPKIREEAKKNEKLFLMDERNLWENL